MRRASSVVGGGRCALLALALAACGKQGELMRRPPPGQPAVVDASRPPPSQALQVPTQFQPARVDDPLRRSEERRDDRFNLPPQD